MSRNPQTLVDVATRLAGSQGDRLAYLFLEDGDTEAARLSFAQLDDRARRIAAGLLRIARPGDRALLVYESPLDFLGAFFGCLYAGIIAVPVPAPEANRRQQGLPRLESILNDCGARLTLCNGYSETLLRGFTGDMMTLNATTWINTEILAEESAPERFQPDVQAESIAFLQYTSGSTSTPKGVMVSQANLVEHLAVIRQACSYDADSVSVTWMPHFHDYGLIQGMLMPFFNGTPAYLMSPLAFVKHPVRLLRAITKYHGTHTEGPSFAYAHCIRRGNPEQWRGLDLSSWRSIGNAAEPVHPETMERFQEVFAAYGFGPTAMSPAYGLAEATLLATSTPVHEKAIVGHFSPAGMAKDEAVPVAAGAPEIRKIAACGRPLPGTKVAIVDPETRRRVAPNKVGEIWVASGTIPLGYWGRPDESEATFRARIEGESGTTYLRTGDLGFVREDLLYVTSRLKDLIIVRGLNHHPQDIEWTVHEAHAALRPGNTAAFSVDQDGEERLVLVLELKPGEYTGEVLDEIPPMVADALASRHEIPLHAVVLIESGSLLKTSSGKVQRRACRQAFLEGALRTVRVWSPRAARRPGLTVGTAEVVPGSAAQGAGEAEGHSRERADALICWLREYAEHRINSRLIDERRCVPPSIILDFGNRGLFGLQAPESLGGLALTSSDAFRVIEQLGAIDLTLATFVFLHNTNGILPILKFAPAALRDELVPILASGRELAAFALSEPAAGSNVGAVETRAQPEGESAWRLHGVKRWNSTAWAGVISVFARVIQGDGRPGGLTGFVVRQGEPGVRLGPESLTMGMRGIMQNTLHLDGALVSSQRMLGEPGKGMAIATEVLSAGRLAMSAMSLGGVQRCVQLILRYAERREVETGRLIDNPQAAVPISELLHRIAIEKELVQHGAVILDTGGRIEPEIAMAIKVLTTDTLNDAADRLVQILGGRGYMENNLAPQIFRDARMMSIGEGANESLLPAIGRSVRLKDVLHHFLRHEFGAGALADRLTALTSTVERSTALPESSPADAQRAWRDAQLGRLYCAMLELAAGEALAAHATGHAETVLWAGRRLDELERAVERGTPASSALLPRKALRARITAFEENIGNLEPLAPGADLDLDPMLRREAPANATPDLTALNVREKKELLRQLLQARQAPPSEEPEVEVTSS